MKDAIVIIPTYNEIENIEGILAAVFSQYKEVHVLVVDDNSPDQTAQKVEALQGTYANRLFLLKRSGKQGLGTAYIEGFKWCLNRSYEYIFEMDADFSHNPKDLQRLYEACKSQNADVAVGSRYIKGVNVVNWPLERILLSYGASVYVRIITGMKVLDPTAGFVCYKRKVLEAIDLEGIKFIGYAFQIEMKYTAYKKNFNIKEIPIIFTDRLRGVSKLHKGIIKEAIFGVIKMRLKTILGTS
ncbi:polyprenol monophosphomannose synthase [Flavobacteriaceae bacterium]|nr:polyprenol monophosphomannose synthase [Flavobacteriaceae bacterium]